MRIEGRVMQRAEGDAVRRDRRTEHFTVANDMSGLQEWIAPQTTDRTEKQWLNELAEREGFGLSAFL
jgi:hypothetical protein